MATLRLIFLAAPERKDKSFAPSDPLDDRAKAQAEAAAAIAAQLAESSHQIHIWHSPFENAKQTADFVFQFVSHTAPIIDVECSASPTTPASPRIAPQGPRKVVVEEDIFLRDQDDGVRLISKADTGERWSKYAQLAGAFFAREPNGESSFLVCKRLIPTLNRVQMVMTRVQRQQFQECFGTLFHSASTCGWEQQARFFKESLDNETLMNFSLQERREISIVFVTHPRVIKAFLLIWHRYSPEWYSLEPNPPFGSVQLSVLSDDRGYQFGGFCRTTGEPFRPHRLNETVHRDTICRRGDPARSYYANHVDLLSAKSHVTASTTAYSHGHTQFELEEETEDDQSPAQHPTNIPRSSLPKIQVKESIHKIHIVLIRCAGSGHSLSPSNLRVSDPELPLTDLNRQQARLVGAELRRHLESRLQGPSGSHEVGHVRMWVSPYRRARETAGELLAALNPSFAARQLVGSVRENIFLAERELGYSHHRLKGIVHIGPAEAERTNRFRLNRNCEFWQRAVHGESNFDVMNRMSGIISDIHAGADLSPTDPIKTVIIVSHADVIRAFICAWMRYSCDWFEREPIPPECSMQFIDQSMEDQGYISGTQVHSYGYKHVLRPGAPLWIPGRDEMEREEQVQAVNSVGLSWEEAAEKYSVSFAALRKLNRDNAKLLEKYPKSECRNFGREFKHIDIGPIPPGFVSRRGDPGRSRWSPFLPHIFRHSTKATDDGVVNAAISPLRIILVRHGLSEANINPGIYKELSDPEIPLSETGKTQATNGAKVLLEYLKRTQLLRTDEWTYLWTSPFRRTRETAECFLKLLNPPFGYRWVDQIKESVALAEKDWGVWEGVGWDQLLRFDTKIVVNDKGEEKCVARQERDPEDSRGVDPESWVKEHCDGQTLERIAELNRERNPDLARDLLAAAAYTKYSSARLGALSINPNGESLADVAARMSHMCANLRHDYDMRGKGDRVSTAILVTHGDAIRAFLSAFLTLPCRVSMSTPGNASVYVIHCDDIGHESVECIFPGYETSRVSKDPENHSHPWMVEKQFEHVRLPFHDGKEWQMKHATTPEILRDDEKRPSEK